MTRPLSVLHLSTSDSLGGSAQSARMIHRGLQARGITSRMLVGRKAASDPEVDVVSRGPLRLADRAALKATRLLSLQYAYVPSSSALLRHPWLRSADLVQLYNTHGDYFSHTVLPRLTRAKPTVWRLSDMWPMTGHCAYPGDCGRWRTGCGTCPDLEAYPSLRRDTTAWLWEQKRRLYAESRLHIVAPSRWILEAAEASPLLAPFPKSLIPNGVDTSVFRPLDRRECRLALGLPPDGRVFLFLANNVLDPIKGAGIFAEAVNALWDAGQRDVLVLAVGANGESLGSRVKAPVRHTGTVSDKERLARVYNAADVYAHAALRENLPNAILEAMACGTPTVAFDAGGVSQAVRHLETGYLAAAGDVAGFARGLQLLSEAGGAYGRNGLGLVLGGYSLEKQAAAFEALYRRLLEPVAREGAPAS